MAPQTSKPPHVDGVQISFPTPQILLVTLNRPKQMNSITHTTNWQLQQLFEWFDGQLPLRVAVITGSGSKAFCCGSDLKEIEQARNAKLSTDDLRKSEPYLHDHPRAVFGGCSRRRGRKPLLVGVNGLALGGGFEVPNHFEKTTCITQDDKDTSSSLSAGSIHLVIVSLSTAATSIREPLTMSRKLDTEVPVKTVLSAAESWARCVAAASSERWAYLSIATQLNSFKAAERRFTS